MPSAYEIVMESRRELVETILKNMEQGYIFSRSEWNRAALRPQNPVSKAWYRGGNRLRLMNAVLQNSYTDPRWMTFRQIQSKGYHLKKGSEGVLCEKWIFEREVQKENELGELEIISEELEHPWVNYFIVYNGQQVEGLSELVLNPQIQEEIELLSLADEMIVASECPVRELGQHRAFYSPSRDEITLPPRTSFKNAESFLGTLIHEQGHSTGHVTRLNRDMKGIFGSESYAKEELKVELAAIFVEADLNLDLQAEHFNDHTNYLHSWMKALKDDPNELFRACQDAELISSRLLSNLQRKREMGREPPVEVAHEPKQIVKRRKQRR